MDGVTVLTFTNERDAVLAARVQGGPVDVEVDRVARGHWTVTITPR